MIELKISGDNTKDFYENAARAFILLAHGGNTVFAQPPAGDGAPPKSDQPKTDVRAVVEAIPEENPKVAESPKQRKARTPKPEALAMHDAVTIDAKPVEVVDEDPLGLNDVAKPPADEKTYTVDDMRQRVKDILAAHGPKTKDTPNARGNEMPVCVAYVRKLFAPFNVKLAADVPPERFAEFMAASEPYLDGSAE